VPGKSLQHKTISGSR